MTGKGKPAPPPVVDERYPLTERFIETAQPEDIAELFRPVREALTGLKGPQADKGKKVTVAVDRAEELLRFLLETREKLKTSTKKR